MKTFPQQLKWQFVLLQKNSIISISFAVTIIYGLILYFLRNASTIDQILISLVLNDPAIIGYFFIALAIYSETKHQILSAIIITPATTHQILLSKTVSLAIIGTICSLGLVLLVKGLEFDILSFAIGTFSICIMSILLGLIMLTFTNDFLKFTMRSIPVFLAFVNLPLLQYLGGINMSLFKFFFPIQGSLDLIDYALSGTDIYYWYSYLSIIICIPLLYIWAYRLFSKKIVQQ